MLPRVGCEKTQTLISTWRVLLWSERRRRSVEDTAMMSFLAFDYGSIAKVQVNAHESLLNDFFSSGLEFEASSRL